MKTVKIDYSKSSVKWKGYKPGGGHQGTLNIKEGKVDMNDDNVPVGGVFTFDMNTISDDDQKGMMKDKLEQHLKSDEFFNVPQFPLATFTITKIDPNSDNEGYYMVNGTLEIKGVKNDISFKARYMKINNELEIETQTISLDRTRWNIDYGSKGFLKKLTEHVIANNFDVDIQIWVNV